MLEGRYRVICLRGQGGFGKTYEVSDLDHCPKILKVLTDNYPKHVELFQREAHLLSQLDHPGIPKVEPNAYFTFYPRNWQDPLHCLVMEKIVGLDLQDYLRQRGHPIDEKLAIQWMKQVVKILDVVHAQQVLHRDIKPSNIMLRANGNISLVDFGTARSVTNVTHAHQGGTRVVSSFYTPREQMHGQGVPQSDFFALGRTFVYLLTGKDLSEFYDSRTDEFSWRSALVNISTPFADLLDALMAERASQRPATAQIILQQLVVLESSGKPVSTPAAPSSPELEPTQAIHLSPSSAQSSETTSAPPPAQPASGGVRPDFKQQCTPILAEFIGPIAPIVYQRTVAEHPHLSEKELVKQLSAQIPNPQQASEFLQRFQF